MKEYFTKATTHGIETFSAKGKTIIKEARGIVHIQDAEFNADFRFASLEDAMRWVCRYGSPFGAKEVIINGMRIPKSLSDFTFGEILVGQGGHICHAVHEVFWENSWACPDTTEGVREFIAKCEGIARRRRDHGCKGFVGYDDEDFRTDFSDTPVEMEYVEFDC